MAQALPRVIQRPSDLFGTDSVKLAPKIVLPEPSTDEIERTERRFIESRKVPIGLFRKLGIAPDTEGAWTDLSVQARNRMWAVVLQSTAAFGVRLRFSHFSLPAEARLVIYPEKHPEVAVEYIDQGPFGKGDFWSAPMYGDTVVMELYDGTAEVRTTVPHYFDIQEIVHEYRNVVGPIGTAGSCNLNAVCYPAWSSQGDAVGRVAGIDSVGEFACSGTLVANNSSDFSPLFLTATHCVYGESVAGIGRRVLDVQDRELFLHRTTQYLLRSGHGRCGLAECWRR